MADYLDNFVDPNGTLLSAHTADSGHKYESTTLLEIYTNELSSPYEGTTSNPPVYVLESDGVTKYVTGSEFDVVVEATVRSDNGEIAFSFCVVDSDNRYQIALTSNAAVLGKLVGGEFASLGSVPIVSGDTITVEVRSSTLEVKKNGAAAFGPLSETDLTRAGYVMYPTGRGEADVTRGYNWESASITNISTTPTIRKSSTFDIETTLTGSLTGVGASATLNGNAISVNSHTGTTVNLTDDNSGITTSGEYSLVLTDDTAATETITVQVNVVGVAPSSNPLQKDGAALASLTGVQVRIANGSNLNGVQRYYTATGTTDASGNLGNIDLSDTVAAVDDPVLLQVLTAAGDSITASETVGLI